MKRLSNVETIVDSSCRSMLLTGNIIKISFPDYQYFTILILQLSQFPENESIKPKSEATTFRFLSAQNKM
jgi:hypothetical protein